MTWARAVRWAQELLAVETTANASASQLKPAAGAVTDDGIVRSEAEQIVIAALRKPGGEKLTRGGLLLGADEPFSQAAQEALERMCRDRVRGFPLQHVIGWQEFGEHEYEVGPQALIPRQETELLLRHALDELEDPRLGLELGLGSGILSIELLAARPGLRMRASELTASAAALAERNARKILGPGADRLEILYARSPLEILEPLMGEARADFLISNPPYLVRGADETTDEVAAHEPAAALWAPDSDPFHFYRGIADQAREVLKPGAPVYLEMPHERADAILALFAKSWSTTLHSDLNGRSRVLIARLR